MLRCMAFGVYTKEQWERARQIYIDGGGVDGGLIAASRETGIPYRSLNQKSYIEKWASSTQIVNRIESSIGLNLVDKISQKIRDWTASMLSTINKSQEFIIALDAKSAPKDWPEFSVRESALKMHQDRVRQLLGIEDSSNTANARPALDWKHATVIDAVESKASVSTNETGAVVNVVK